MDKYRKDDNITWVNIPLSKSTCKALGLKAKTRGKNARRYLQGLIHKDLRED